MADFLLIHGSCHGAWCWRDAIPALSALGHTARAIDLPGAGDDQTPMADVTLDSCRDAVLAASSPDTIVVGHSWGGYPISAAGEADPSALRALVFLCAYVPVSGSSMEDMRKKATRQLPRGAVQLCDDRVSYAFDPDRAPDILYHDCPPEVVAFAAAHRCPQPFAPQNTPLTLTGNFASLPKAFIRGADDRVIPPEDQAGMTRNWPADTVYEMATSHSPFFADPAGLATCLDAIAKRL